MHPRARLVVRSHKHLRLFPTKVQLHAVGVDLPDPEGANSTALALTLDMLEMPAEELERRFRDVWGNNADEIRCIVVFRVHWSTFYFLLKHKI